MKTAKTILGVVIGVVGLVLLIALFIEKDYSVERSVVINKPTPEVFNYIKHLKNQDEYSSFAMKDPKMKRSFKGTDATAGFVYAWDSNADAGKGEQEIKNIVEGERVEVVLRFVKPIKGVAASYMVTENIDPRVTRLHWGFKSQVPYPFNIIRFFIDVEEMMGKEIQTSLDNIRTRLENRSQTPVP